MASFSTARCFLRLFSRARIRFVLAAWVVVFVVVGVVVPVRLYTHEDPLLLEPQGPASWPIGIVADMDTASRSKAAEFAWESVFKTGVLSRDVSGAYSIRWVKDIPLSTKLGESNRAMELSELIVFNGHLYACDDRTGIVFEILRMGSAIPRWILVDGDGMTTDKGFKCEWATIKDGRLLLGSIGKEFTDAKTGEIRNENPLYVKIIDDSGRVSHVLWKSVYQRLRQATGTTHPGYMIHEAVNWSPVLRRWAFLPRRASNQSYNDELDEMRGTNLLILADERFAQIEVRHMQPDPLPDPTHGFSSFKFVPDAPMHMVALKTREFRGEAASYITVLTTKGKVLLNETYIDDIKFEGIEFLPQGFLA